jgi:hypothetical protein
MQRLASHPAVTYAVADVRALGWPAGSCGALIDKATLDTLLNAAGNDNDDSASADAEAEAMLAEAARVLSPGEGVLLCVSSGAPAERLPLLLRGGARSSDAAAQTRPRFALARHVELARGRATFHAYVLRRCAEESCS